MEAYVLVAGWLLLLAAWVSAVVHAATRPKPLWKRTGRNKAVWLIAITLIGGVAGVYYWLVVRRDLQRAGEPRHASVPTTSQLR